MSIQSRHIRATVFTGAILLHLISTSAHVHLFDFVISLLSIVAVAIAIPHASSMARTLTFIFILSGSWMLWARGIHLPQYISLYGNMLHLLSLFVIIPLLAIPIQLGGYSKIIKRLLHLKVRSQQHLYQLISGSSFFLSCFMNLATLPMMYYSVKDTIDQYPIQSHKRFVSMSIVHGYALPILWTPVAPIVGVVLDLTGVSWIRMFPVLLSLSLGGLILDWSIHFLMKNRLSFSKIQDKQARREAATTLEEGFMIDKSEAKIIKRKLMQLGLVISFFILLITTLEHALPIGMVLTTVLMTFPFAAIWSGLMGKGASFLEKASRHVSRYVPDMAEQFAIFLSAGFFVKALELTGHNHEVNVVVQGLNHWMGDPLFLALLPFIPLGLSFTGMHPVVAIALLAESLNPQLLGISVEKLTVALLGGAVTTFLMGPFNATIGIMSSIIKETPLRISAWNGSFTAGFVVLLIGFLYFLP
ncbi:hypothetical protein C8P63_102163 [Melghirimyces profundicolus]|uniref:Uncharacterized protein n=1 Tax=Melghirimyces profundicolus TaxID=1242148 RepID=A0A2T6C8P8_9BACL|nr:hypothetical protein [Melghirimyces profundicolus]PTX64669.1 hypothetical protein C8P63_102163 [Melghirimyces profundicolus]